MSDIEESIAEDQKQHPKCNYSRQYSKECRSINGKLKCDEVQRIFRVCPGKRPVEIHRTEVSGDDNIMDDTNAFDDNEGEIWEGSDDPFGMNMDKIFQQQMMGLMQMANMFMAASGMNEDIYGNEESYQQSPFYDDRAPIPRQEQPSSTEPTFVAPHQNQSGNQSKQTPRTSAARHRYSEFQDKTNEF